MNWEALGAVAELLAAVGVIFSLVYLAVQIRQNTSNIDFNTKALRGGAYTSQLQMRNDFQDLLLQNEQLSNVWMKGMYRPDALDEIEVNYFRNLAFRFLFTYESVVLMHGAGLIEDELFQSLNNSNSKIFIRPGLQEHWRGYRSQFALSFQVFLDNLPPVQDSAEPVSRNVVEE